jgi:hypothetical protein
MKIINKKTMVYLAWLVVLIAAILAAWFSIFRETFAVKTVPPPAALQSTDVITTQLLRNGNTLVGNATSHYEAIIPSVWYIEKKEGGGLAIYPGYDPMKKTPPHCKVEISSLQSSYGVDADDWLTDYLHKDPTVDIVESQRMPSTISGNPAITWTGTLNGVSTTLAYIFREDGGVYEIAPSTVETDTSLNGNGSSVSSEDCQDAFEALVSSFRILP